MKEKATKVRLTLTVKGTDIELSPAEARELVLELAKLTGQSVDAAPVVLPTPYPVYPRWDHWWTDWTRPYRITYTDQTGDGVVWSSSESATTLRLSAT